MDPISAGIALTLLGGLALSLKKQSVSDQSLDQTPEVLEKIKDATKIPIPPIERWVQVEGPDGLYLVSPIYIAPVGIGEAKKIADANGYRLPTPELVDAIWKAADLKIEPHPRAHDGTAKTMNSPETNVAQLAYIKQQIDEKNPNWDFKLLAGSHKDVVFIPQAFGKSVNKVGIYGWHKLNGKPTYPDFAMANGDKETRVIQQQMWGHGLDWKDYSQGVRLVKKIS